MLGVDPPFSLESLVYYNIDRAAWSKIITFTLNIWTKNTAVHTQKISSLEGASLFPSTSKVLVKFLQGCFNISDTPQHFTGTPRAVAPPKDMQDSSSVPCCILCTRVLFQWIWF